MNINNKLNVNTRFHHSEGTKRNKPLSANKDELGRELMRAKWGLREMKFERNGGWGISEKGEIKAEERDEDMICRFKTEKKN